MVTEPEYDYAHDRCGTEVLRWQRRAEQAEAALARVRAALEQIDRTRYSSNPRDYHALPDLARAALEGRVNNPHMNSSEDK